MLFFEVKRSRMSIFGEHYVVLSSLKTHWYDANVEKPSGNWDWTLMLRMWILHHCTASYQRRYLLFCGRRSTLDWWSGKIAKRIGTRPSALHSTFHFWRKSRKLASFLMLSSSKIEEVWQNCFVLDVVKFRNWGSLAELLRFGCCQVQQLRKCRKIAACFQACR